MNFDEHDQDNQAQTQEQLLPQSWQTMPSVMDQSVNHVMPADDGGFWETRWVQRKSEYGIIYVSSHTGCNLSCRFCHLTATGQVKMTPATPTDYLSQAKQSLQTYLDRVNNGMTPAKYLHVNFMARGEALANKYLVETPEDVFNPIGNLIAEHNLDTRFLISSILPKDFNYDLSKVLSDRRSFLYYSLYSMKPEFRKRWLPKSSNPLDALDMIQDYQKNGGNKVTLHWALIEGQNDSMADAELIADAVVQRNLNVKFNLVRYNPHDHRQGAESNEDVIANYFKNLTEALKISASGESKIIPRVGKDVFASCGMFIEK